MCNHFKIKFVILLIAASMILTSCVVAVVAGAAVAGLVYDRRSVNTLADDTRIFHVVHTKIATDHRFRNSRILITSFNRVVLLLGQTQSPSLKQIAFQYAKSTAGVERVYNEVTLANPLNLQERSQDTWITSQVRAAMLARRDLESGSIRIVTECGVVYLMGIVTLTQSNLAVDVARRIKGVNKVVKIFRYIH